MDCKNKTLLYILAGVALAIMVFAIVYNTCGKDKSGGSSDDGSEPFGAPERIIQVGNNESSLNFLDRGMFSPIQYVGWETPGTSFQPYVALDQGLYTNQGWTSNTQLPCALRNRQPL